MINGQQVFVNEAGDVSFDSDITPYLNLNNHPFSTSSISGTFSDKQSNSDLNEYCKPEAYLSDIS